MTHYFVDNRTQPDGAHEVHAVGCKRMASDKQYLGDFLSCEQAVFEALDRLMEGKTSIVIAHHLKTILHADAIFVVKDNHLTEHGTHDELLAAGGFYAELYGIQSGEPVTQPV